MTPQLYTLGKTIQSFFKHHHPILFFSLIALVLGVAVFMLYQVMAESTTDQSISTSTIGAFDQKTIEKIKELHSSGSSDNVNLVFPSPRPNPFVE